MGVLYTHVYYNFVHVRTRIYTAWVSALLIRLHRFPKTSEGG